MEKGKPPPSLYSSIPLPEPNVLSRSPFFRGQQQPQNHHLISLLPSGLFSAAISPSRATSSSSSRPWVPRACTARTARGGTRGAAASPANANLPLVVRQ